MSETFNLYCLPEIIESIIIFPWNKMTFRQRLRRLGFCFLLLIFCMTPQTTENFYLTIPNLGPISLFEKQQLDQSTGSRPRCCCPSEDHGSVCALVWGVLLASSRWRAGPVIALWVPRTEHSSTTRSEGASGSPRGETVGVTVCWTPSARSLFGLHCSVTGFTGRA